MTHTKPCMFSTHKIPKAAIVASGSEQALDELVEDAKGTLRRIVGPALIEMLEGRCETTVVVEFERDYSIAEEAEVLTLSAYLLPPKLDLRELQVDNPDMPTTRSN